MAYKINDFYVPSTRRELIRWLHDYYKNRKGNVQLLALMENKQLYAIYYRIRKAQI